MDIGAAFIADGEPAETVEPSQRALGHPAVAAEPFAAVEAAAGDPRRDVPASAGTPAEAMIVGLVTVQRGRALARPAAFGFGTFGLQRRRHHRPEVIGNKRCCHAPTGRAR